MSCGILLLFLLLSSCSFWSCDSGLECLSIRWFVKSGGLSIVYDIIPGGGVNLRKNISRILVGGVPRLVQIFPVKDCSRFTNESNYETLGKVPGGGSIPFWRRVSQRWKIFWDRVPYLGRSFSHFNVERLPVHKYPDDHLPVLLREIMELTPSGVPNLLWQRTSRETVSSLLVG